MKLTSGLLVEEVSLYEGKKGESMMRICDEGEGSLKKDKIPLFALTNGLWLGHVPVEIEKLTIPEHMLITLEYPHCFVFKMHPLTTQGRHPDTLQHGMVGNIMSYTMDTCEIIDMLEG